MAVRVWIVAVPGEGTPGRETLEALALARELGEGTVLVRTGSEDPGSYGPYGAARVLALTPGLGDADARQVARALTETLSGETPDLVILPPGPWGREVGTRLAVRLGTGFLSDVQGVEVVETGTVRARKSIYGGKAVATVTVRGRPAILAPKERTFDPVSPTSGEAAVETRVLTLPEPVVERESREVTEKAGPSLTDARRVVSGGRGLGGPESFKLLDELADVLGAAVGASRAAVDAGWVPASYQVGQTGVSVAPDLYLAIGISGASQHIAGITRAKHIVAINKDPEAPIFQLAEFGVVGDYKEVLPSLTEALRARTHA